MTFGSLPTATTTTYLLLFLLSFISYWRNEHREPGTIEWLFVEIQNIEKEWFDVEVDDDGSSC